ncbi:MAG: sugar phosphate isomerase/epimerase [Treponema sp.]|jgi:sugar phosphate isomerase/epimerase|nr:sugar phosphate isomerase/epimerase [Treponema sp.]
MKVGIQLYSVRNHMEKDPVGTIRHVAEAGYRYIEAANHHADKDSGTGFGAGAKEIKKVLEDTGTRIISAHIAPFNAEIIKPVLEYYAELESAYIVAPMDFFKDKADVLAKCEVYNELAGLCAGAGMQFLYHNHFHEFQIFDDKDGKTIFDLIMENTDPALVGVELDTYWAARGGQDPVKLLEKYGERTRLIHQKDIPAAWREKINLIEPVNTDKITVDINYFMSVVSPEAFTEIGSGILPIQEIINAGNRGRRTDYIVLEQDFSRHDEYESIRISMESFRKFTGIEW